MDFIEMRKRAKRVTKQRSMKPDIEYIFWATVMSLTVVGLPIACCIIQTYHEYLKTARENYEYGSDKKNLIYPHKSVRSIMFTYNLKSFVKAIRAILYVALPNAMFFKIDKLSDRQNFQLKLEFTQMKSVFADIYVSFLLIISLIALMFINPISWIHAEVIGIIVIIAVMFRPFVTYCQAIVMFEKVANEETPDGEEEEDEEN